MTAEAISPPARRPVRIALDGPDASVRAEDAPRVAHLLAARAPRRALAPPVPGGTAGGFGGWHEGRFRFPAKLALMVTAGLERAGHAVQLPALPGRPVERWESVAPMLRRLIGEPRRAALGGLVPGAPGIDPPPLVYYLLKLFPKVRAVIAAPPGEVRAWRRYLGVPNLGRAVVASVRDARLWRGRRAVLVTRLSDLDHCQPDDFDLVIIPDARLLARCPLSETGADGGWRRTFPAPREWRVTTFGFLPGGTEGLSDWELLTLGNWFGGLLRPREPAAVQPLDPLGWFPIPAPPRWPGA